MRREELREVVLLCKGSLLARTMNKDQGTLIAISNYTPRVNRSRVPAVKLVLDTSRIIPLPSLPRYSLLYYPSSNQKYNLVRPENLPPL